MAHNYNLWALKNHELYPNWFLKSDVRMPGKDLGETCLYITGYRSSSRDVDVRVEALQDGTTSVKIVERTYFPLPQGPAHLAVSARLVHGKAVVRRFSKELTVERRGSVYVTSANDLSEFDEVASDAASRLRHQYRKSYGEEMAKTPLEDIIFTQLIK